MEEAVGLLHDRAPGPDWETHGRREDSRRELFGTPGLVAVAHDLFAETPSLREEDPGGLGLDTGCTLLQKTGPLPHDAPAILSADGGRREETGLNGAPFAQVELSFWRLHEPHGAWLKAHAGQTTCVQTALSARVGGSSPPGNVGVKTRRREAAHAKYETRETTVRTYS